ncbi:MAG: hypothetical protein ABH869_07850 [Candidatus Omnitrophota bacterium]
MDNARKKLKETREIAIAIDNWDDIFSDFDPSPLSERVLSEDFIAEIHKRYRQSRRGRFVVLFIAPQSLRDERSEKTVIQRLKRHYKYKYLQRHKEIARIRIRGFMFVIFGICSLGFLTTITYFKFFSDIAIELLAIIFMPLGWFGIWEGFSKIVDTSPISVTEEKLSKKFAEAEYKFKYVE